MDSDLDKQVGNGEWVMGILVCSGGFSQLTELLEPDLPCHGL